MTPRLPIPGADSDTWGDILNDFLSVSHHDDGAIKPEVITTTALQDSSVSGQKLQDTSISSVKIDAGLGVDGQVLSYNSSTPSGLSWASPSLADDSVSNAKLQADSVSTSKLQDTSVSSAKIQDGAISSTKIQNSSITSAKLNTSAGADGQILALDSAAAGGMGWVTPVRTLRFSLTSFFKSNTLTTTTGTSRLPIDGTYTIVGTQLMVGTAPTGAGIIIDVKKNGATIYTTQANRPTIAANQTAGGPGATPDVTSLAAGDYLTVDIVQIGSTIAGADLTVSVVVDKVI